jgi:hypothetical protein
LASTRREATAGRSREPDRPDASSEKEDAAQTPLTRFHRNCGTEVHCNAERDAMTKLNYPQWNCAPTPAASVRIGERGCPTGAAPASLTWVEIRPGFTCGSPTPWIGFPFVGSFGHPAICRNLSGKQSHAASADRASRPDGLKVRRNNSRFIRDQSTFS